MVGGPLSKPRRGGMLTYIGAGFVGQIISDFSVFGKMLLVQLFLVVFCWSFAHGSTTPTDVMVVTHYKKPFCNGHYTESYMIRRKDAGDVDAKLRGMRRHSSATSIPDEKFDNVVYVVDDKGMHIEYLYGEKYDYQRCGPVRVTGADLKNPKWPPAMPLRYKPTVPSPPRPTYPARKAY